MIRKILCRCRIHKWTENVVRIETWDMEGFRFLIRSCPCGRREAFGRIADQEPDEARWYSNPFDISVSVKEKEALRIAGFRREWKKR